MKKILLLLFVPLLLIGCYKAEVGVIDVLTIKEGEHKSKPYDLTWNDDINQAYRWRFNESVIYDLGNENQCDWNKLTGRSFHFFSNHKRSIMAAWRYDLDGFVWVAPYYHIDNEAYFTIAPCSDGLIQQAAQPDPNLNAVRVEVGQWFETHITIRDDISFAQVTIINPTTGQTSYFEMDPGDFNNTREIYPWFGGDEVAPHQISIERELIDVE